MLRVVTYHRIGRPEETPLLDPALISATPEVFIAQIDHLRRSYDVLSMSDVLDAIRNETRLPRRAVLLTFDDAYCDFATVAWPLLKARGLPATLFVPTAYASSPRLAFWWDRLYRAVTHLDRKELRVTGVGQVRLGTSDEIRAGLKLLRRHVKGLPPREAASLVDWIVNQTDAAGLHVQSVLGWNQLRELAAQGVTLAAHTRTHPILPNLSIEEIRDEIRGSQADLRRELGKTLPVFCYPNGSTDDRVVDVLRNSGFVLAFTTEQGHNRIERAERLRLCRTDITMRTTPAVFRLRMHTLGNYIDRWRTS